MDDTGSAEVGNRPPATEVFLIRHTTGFGQLS